MKGAFGFGNKKLLYSDAENKIYVYEIQNGDKTEKCLMFSENNFALRQGCIYTKFTDKISLEYQKIMLLGTGFTKEPKNILMLGFGIGTMTTELMGEFPASKIDIVEINPKLPEVAEKYFDFKPSANAKFFIQDAHDFVLENQSKKYDVIFLDVFDESYIPPLFLTKMFFEKLKNLLTKNGVLIINTFSTSKTYTQETELIKFVFPNSLQIKSSNRIIFAKKEKFEGGDLILTKRAKDRFEYKKYRNKFEPL